MQGRNFSDEEILKILNAKNDDSFLKEILDDAYSVRHKIFSNKVFVRALIEFSSWCKNDCCYCGLRCSNKNAVRYRLSQDEILECCKNGYALGIRTFVLQSGEDPFFDDEKICLIVNSIKALFPDCAVTLSIGEKSKESYQKFFNAGADRFLLRHETANEGHYQKLHPKNLSLQNRKECLFNLKKIGFQTGSGFMVDSPFQTDLNIIEDLKFLKELEPQMIGIGPFISHHQTPFSRFKNGSAEKTLRLIAILRLMFPHALIPSTTALNTLDKNGRQKGMDFGANVLMPNLSPHEKRKFYSIYDNKIFSDAEDADNFKMLENELLDAGYKIVIDRGDFKNEP